MNLRRKRALSVFLSLIGAGGTVATALLTRKTAIKETKWFGRGLEDNSELTPETKKELVIDTVKLYTPVIVVGGITVASIVGSTILSRKTEASLISMAVLADNGWRKYKHQVKRYLGDSEHLLAVKGVARQDAPDWKDIPKDDDERELYFEEHVGYFLAKPADVLIAYGDMNQRLHTVEYGVSAFYTMVYDFLKTCKAELLDENIKPEDLQWGWSGDYLSETFDYAWVHWTLTEDVTPDGKRYNIIDWHEPPILNPGNYGEVWYQQSAKNTDFYEESESDYKELQINKKT